MQDYIELASRTKSDKFYGDRIALTEFTYFVRTAAEWIAKLDPIKKTLFYGKDYQGQQQTFSPNVNPVALAIAGQFPGGPVAALPRGVDVIHAIIGKATEAGEALEALLKVIDGEQFDAVNYFEEIGDGLWYDAIGLAAVGKTFDDAQAANIRKLQDKFAGRYKDAVFTQAEAETRNLDKERDALLSPIADRRQDDSLGPDLAIQREG